MAPLRAPLLLCALFALGATTASRPARAATAEPSALAFTDGRAGVSLDGAWHVIVDPYDNGSLDYRSQPRPHGYFDDARPRDKSDLVEYDFARSPTLQVPGDWNTQRAELLYYEGTSGTSAASTPRYTPAAARSCSSARPRSARPSG